MEVYLATWLLIVLPIRSSPRLGTQSSQGAIQVVEDISLRLLISDLDED
jgi:hypothetical protein